jgi:hypothetical protein
MLSAFCERLAATPASLFIQDHIWIVAATQSIHIIAITIITCGVLAIDLRLMGITKKGPDLLAMERRFLPWIWAALLVLLGTGLILVLGEPSRELLNKLFWTKMVMVGIIVGLTAAFQTRIKRDPTAWQSGPSERLAAKLVGAASALLIILIIIAGRWIAYVLNS